MPHCPVQPDNSAENDLAVTRYLEIGTALARQVRAGDLAPGSELPAVREHARLLGATSSTIVRAHRWLADGGVITLADRRRARVATDGPVAAARLLESDRVFRLAGSDDPALQLLLAHVGPAVVQSARGAASTACAHSGAVTPTAPRSTCATAPASTTPPTPALCSPARTRTCCTCGAANRASSSPPATPTTSAPRPTWPGGSSPAASPAPEPGSCSTSSSSPPGSARTPSPDRNSVRTWRSRWPSRPGSPTPP